MSPLCNPSCSNINNDSATRVCGLELFAFILLLNVDYTDNVDEKH